MSLHVVVLAAGVGTRMQSAFSKLLHPLAGQPLLAHVLKAVSALDVAQVHIIHGHDSERLRTYFQDANLNWVYQEKQLGTGHAVLCALPHIPERARVLVLCGDVPLIQVTTLQQLISQTSLDHLGLVTANLDNPFGYGRIVRNRQQQVIGIVEQKDATPAEQALCEVYAGILVASATFLKQVLPTLSNHNAQGEYYLTDVVRSAVEHDISIQTTAITYPEEILGVNDRQQLAQLERCYQRMQTQALMKQGVSFADPARFDMRGELICGRDVYIDIDVICEGRVVLSDGVHVGPFTLLKQVEIAAGTKIHSHSILEDCTIGQTCSLGPFARIRPGTHLDNNVHIGNFVELKKSQVSEGSKINHLSYIGDAIIGRHVNVGAGTITCNYDGVNKYQTVIEEGVFIGSDTQLIAPVTIGRNAYIATGSTVRKDVPADSLTLTQRLQQRTVAGWKRPEKKKES